LLLAGASAADGVEVEVSVVAVLDSALRFASFKVKGESLSNDSWGAFALASITVPDLVLQERECGLRAVLWRALDGTSLNIVVLTDAWGSWGELAGASVSVEESCSVNGISIVVGNRDGIANLWGANARASLIIPLVGVGWAPLGQALAVADISVSVEVETDWAWSLSASALTSLGVEELSAWAAIIVEVTDFAVLVVEVLVGIEGDSRGSADALVSLSIVVGAVSFAKGVSDSH